MNTLSPDAARQVDDFVNTLGPLLKKRREELKLSARAVAVFVGMDPSNLSRIETAGREIRVVSLLRLCIALNYNPVDLFSSFSLDHADATKDSESRPPKHLTDWERAEILRLRKNGNSMQGIARTIGRSYGAVQYVLAHHQD